jgi:ribonuclease HI
VGEDGWLVGWKEEAERLLRRWGVDEEGWVIDRSGGDARRVSVDEAEKLKVPPVAMVTRARAALAVKQGVEVHDGELFKRKHTHVNPTSTRRMLERLLTWYARLGLTRIFATDGSRGTAVVPAEGGKTSKVPRVSRAVVADSGEIIAAALDHREADNYLAELVALCDALKGCVNERVAIITDAQSPVRAWLRFSRRAASTRQDYLYAEELGRLDRLLRRQRTVVIIWQCSHTGEVCNEWADLATGEVDPADIQPLNTGVCEFASLRWPMAKASLRLWAGTKTRRAIKRRLREGMESTKGLYWSAELHIRVPQLSDKMELVRRAILNARAQAADRSRFAGRLMKRLAASVQCVCGQGKATWWHCHFECQQELLVSKRREYVVECNKALDAQAASRGSSGKSETLMAVESRARYGVPEMREGLSFGWRRHGEAHWGIEPPEAERAVVGGLFVQGDERMKEVEVESAHSTTVKGLALQMAAREMLEEQDRELRKRVEGLRLLERVLGGWRRVVREGGPKRRNRLAVQRYALAIVMGRIEEEQWDAREEEEAVSEVLERWRAHRAQTADPVEQGEAQCPSTWALWQAWAWWRRSTRGGDLDGVDKRARNHARWLMEGTSFAPVLGTQLIGMAFDTAEGRAQSGRRHWGLAGGWATVEAGEEARRRWWQRELLVRRKAGFRRWRWLGKLSGGDASEALSKLAGREEERWTRREMKAALRECGVEVNDGEGAARLKAKTREHIRRTVGEDSREGRVVHTEEPGSVHLEIAPKARGRQAAKIKRARARIEGRECGRSGGWACTFVEARWGRRKRGVTTGQRPIEVLVRWAGKWNPPEEWRPLGAVTPDIKAQARESLGAERGRRTEEAGARKAARKRKRSVEASERGVRASTRWQREEVSSDESEGGGDAGGRQRRGRTQEEADGESDEEEDALVALLRDKRKREEKEERMRKRVREEMDRRMDTGIRVNAELVAAWK